MREPRSILVVCIRLIGDVILSTPLTALLKEAYPSASIDFLVNRGTGEFLEKDPRVRKVFFVPNREFFVGGDVSGSWYVSKIFMKYDMAISMNASDRGNIAAVLAGRKVRVGFHHGNDLLRSWWKRAFLTHPVEFPFAIHVARLCQLVADALGIPVEKLVAKVFWDDVDDAIVAARLREKEVAGPFFVVHPFPRWRYKYWKMERFAEVSDAVSARYGLVPVWTSSPDRGEIDLLHRASAHCRRSPAVMGGEFSLNQMTCLLSKSSLYVGLDTAVSHLAATTGVPMVVLFGPTIAERWSPWYNDGPVAQQCPLPRGTQRSGKMILVQKDWPCVPCGKAGCDDQGGESLCMTEIETAEVLHAVDLLLPDLPRG
jgi:heptosyltransferase-3